MAAAKRSAKDAGDAALSRAAEDAAMLDGLHESRNQMEGDASIRYVAVCVTPCTFRGQYWPVGRVYRGFTEPPAHFERADGNDAVPAAWAAQEGARAVTGGD